jgi:hypothetical protein
MNKSIEQIHSDIFHSFVTYLPDLVYLMKTSEHGINLHKPNPYHMEGDVWTHTCLVYQALLYVPQFHELPEQSQHMACMAALCHDLGKPYKRFVNEYNRPRFGGHEQRSVVEMMNVTDFLVSVHGYNDEMIYDLMAIVASHSVYWLSDSMQNVLPCLNYNPVSLDIYKVLSMADQMGQIRRETGEKKNIYEFEFDLTPPVSNRVVDPTKKVYITIGAPGSGKDYVLNMISDHIKIVSYDQLRVELYKEEMGDVIKDLPSTELYSNARKWVIKKKVNLDPPMYKIIRDWVVSGVNYIGISNTNMTRKGRMHVVRKIRELCPEYTICYVFVFAHTEDLIMRDKNRKDVDKMVGEQAIYQILNNFELPIMDEGVDEIAICYNGTGM